jgi:soluble lytic murein transglycosylase
MKKKLFSILTIIICGYCLGQASPQITKIPISWRTDYKPAHWLFSRDQQYKGPSKLAELAEIKKLEFNKNYVGCAEKTFRLFSKQSDLKHWLVMQGLACLNRALESDPTWDSVLIRDWFKKLKSSSDLYDEVILRDELLFQWQQFLLTVLKRPNLNQKLKWEIADHLYPYQLTLPQSLRVDYFKALGELVTLAGFKDIAKLYFSRAEKIAGTTGFLGSNTASNFNGINSNGKNTPVPVSNKSKDLLAEETAYQNFLDLLNRNAWLQAGEKGIEFLDQYPGSGKAQVVSDKLISSYNNFFDKSSQDQKTMLDHWRATLSKAHPSRVEEWARVCHRRGDFEAAIVFSKRALSSEEKSTAGAALLFIAGRSHFFLGKYDDAMEFFDKLLGRHSGYSENVEVKFRKALIHLRQSSWEDADKLLSEIYSEKKSYGLSALYWLIRLREKRGQNTDDLYTLMQEKYYLTYYGLLLSAEKKKQKLTLDWPSAEPIKEQFFVTDNEFSSWLRAKKLIQAGWYLEADRELELVFNSQTPQQKAVLFQTYAEMFSFRTIISWATELFDTAPVWRNKELLALVYPFPFREWIEVETKKYGLSPYLIVSLMRQESAFNLRATSGAQAQGLMQLIPATVQEVAQDLRMKDVSITDMYHPPTNIKFGTYYLSKVIKQFAGNVSIGLAAYNAGPQRLKKFFEGRSEVLKQETLSQQDPWSDLWIEELPWLETNLYVKSILRNAIIYQLIDKKEVEVAKPVWLTLINGKSSL